MSEKNKVNHAILSTRSTGTTWLVKRFWKCWNQFWTNRIGSMGAWKSCWKSIFSASARIFKGFWKYLDWKSSESFWKMGLARTVWIFENWLPVCLAAVLRKVRIWISYSRCPKILKFGINRLTRVSRIRRKKWRKYWRLKVVRGHRSVFFKNRRGQWWLRFGCLRATNQGIF